MRFLLSLLILTGCPAEPPAEVKAPESTCELTPENLAGRVFVRQTEEEGKGWVDDAFARLKFSDEGGVTKARYSVRSLNSVYGYTCKPAKGDKKADLLCLQDEPNLIEFCRSLTANTGGCTADQLASVLGEPAATPDMVKAVDQVAGEVKKLSPDALKQFNTMYNSPNVQLRGLLKVKIKATKDECRLTIADLYETFSEGKRREMENYVGQGARFVQTKKEFLFEHCTDTANLVATADPESRPAPGEGQTEWAKGSTAIFRYVGPDAGKTEAGCSYTMDTWLNFEAVGTAVPVQTDTKGKPDWSFSRGLTEPGRAVAHIVRYKACGGAPEKISVSCAPVKVQ